VHFNPSALACDLALLAENITLIDFLLAFGLTRVNCADETDAHVRKILDFGVFLSQWMEQQVLGTTSNGEQLPDNTNGDSLPLSNSGHCAAINASTASLSTSSTSNALSSSLKSTERALKEQAARARHLIQLSREFLRLNNLSALYAFHQFAQRCLFASSRDASTSPNVSTASLFPSSADATLQSATFPVVATPSGPKPREPERMGQPPSRVFAHVLGLKESRRRTKERKQLLLAVEDEMDALTIEEPRSACSTFANLSAVSISTPMSSTATCSTTTHQPQQPASVARTLWDYLEADDREHVQFVAMLFRAEEEVEELRPSIQRSSYRNYRSYYGGLQTAPKICCYAIEFHELQLVNAVPTYDHYGNIAVSKFRALVPLSACVLSVKESSYRVVRANSKGAFARNGGKPVDFLLSSNSAGEASKRERANLRELVQQILCTPLDSNYTREKEKEGGAKGQAESRDKKPPVFPLRQCNDILAQFCSTARTGVRGDANASRPIDDTNNGGEDANGGLIAPVRGDAKYRRDESDTGEVAEEEEDFFVWRVDDSVDERSASCSPESPADNGWESLSRIGR
jgi:hypothetical protein